MLFLGSLWSQQKHLIIPRISDSLSPKHKPCPLPFPVGVTLENGTLHMHPPQPETLLSLFSSSSHTSGHQLCTGTKTGNCIRYLLQFNLESPPPAHVLNTLSPVSSTVLKAVELLGGGSGFGCRSRGAELWRKHASLLLLVYYEVSSYCLDLPLLQTEAF